MQSRVPYALRLFFSTQLSGNGSSFESQMFLPEESMPLQIGGQFFGKNELVS